MTTFLQAILTYICLWWPLVFLCLIFDAPTFSWPPFARQQRVLDLGVMPRKFLTATFLAFVLWILAFPIVQSGVVERYMLQQADQLPHS